MVLPSDVVEQEEAEEKTERTKEEEADEGEGNMKEGAEEGPTAEDLDQAVVVVPTPPDTGKIFLYPFSHTKMTMDFKPLLMGMTWEIFVTIFYYHHRQDKCLYRRRR